MIPKQFLPFRRSLCLLAIALLGASVALHKCKADPTPPASSAWQTVAPGVLRASVAIRNSVGARETLWLYSPAHPPTGKLPCLFIAPAGTNLLNGMSLGPGDTPEHIPYVQAGYLVVAYSLDGDTSDIKNMSDLQVGEAMKSFADAHFGLTDSEAALDYALKTIPDIDPRRCYSAGHSSAGTVSLLFAEHEPRLAGCIAYAPCANTEYQVGRQNAKLLPLLGSYIPDFAARFHRASPTNSTSTLRCPVFIFHADDDSVVETGDVQQFVNTLKQTNQNVTYTTVPSGDHYDSMIRQGIPDALQWLATQADSPPAAAAAAP